MKLLITGIEGQVGHHYQFADTSGLEILGTYFEKKPSGPFTTISLDIRSRERTVEVIREFGPDWVVHCAAATDVDHCEHDWPNAKSINVDGTENVAIACAESGAKLIFLSTDYVFDGEKGRYVEDDPTNPVQNYGRSKLMGEAIVKQLDHYVIARASMVYSAIPNKFLNWIQEGITSNNLSAVDDIYCTPTLAEELAQCTLSIARMGLNGTFHTAGAERVTKHEFVRRIVQALGRDANIVKPIKHSARKMRAARIRDASLDTSRITSHGFNFSDMTEGAAKLVSRLKKMRSPLTAS